MIQQDIDAGKKAHFLCQWTNLMLFYLAPSLVIGQNILYYDFEIICLTAFDIKNNLILNPCVLVSRSFYLNLNICLM